MNISQVVKKIQNGKEFVFATPKSLGVNSVTIVCSHGGNTPESVEAARIAQLAGSFTITLTHNKDANLIHYADHSVLYAWGEETNVKENPMAIILNICLEILNSVEGYAHYDKFINGLDIINGIIARGKNLVVNRAKEFALQYQNEKMFYILSSGASFGHAYGFAICSLMEMQWVHASAVHSGEYFHGPFEVTDMETPYILLMNEGRTRELDEKSSSFPQSIRGKSGSRGLQRTWNRYN